VQILNASELPWHHHENAYAAIVLAGGYIERGDFGRWSVEAGDVVSHRAFEGHSNLIQAGGAKIVNVFLPDTINLPNVFRVAEPEMLIRKAVAGSADVLSFLVPTSVSAFIVSDWPDLLAADLRRGPVALGTWSQSAGLAIATVSRGFYKTFGITAAQYRLRAQSQSALKMVLETKLPLAQIAFECGFADQPHLTRSMQRVTGKTPNYWRNVKSVQDVTS
jgi:AraC-like DNA-binding protein